MSTSNFEYKYYEQDIKISINSYYKYQYIISDLCSTWETLTHTTYVGSVKS